jgi:uncharacterized protein YkwD
MRLSAISISFAALVCVFAQTAFGQSARAIPTARLLSSPVNISAATRPRRALLPAETSNVVVTSSEANEVEKQAFAAANRARLQNGLAPLVWDSALYQVARAHSQSMMRRGYFSHQTPDGRSLRERVHAVGIAHFRVLGENIAYNQGFDDPGGFAVERWLISPGHRANILSNEFEQSAIGTSVAADGTVYLTQVFIKR